MRTYDGMAQKADKYDKFKALLKRSLSAIKEMDCPNGYSDLVKEIEGVVK